LPASVARLVWLKELARLFVLPPQAIAATISLLLSAPLTTHNILLNGLAIGFATIVDDLIAMFFLSREQRLLVDCAVSELEEKLADVTHGEIDVKGALQVLQVLPVGEASRLVEQREARDEWVFRRCYAVLLMGVTIFSVQNIRELMPYFQTIYFRSDVVAPLGSASCSNILDTAFFLPMYLAVVASWLHMFARWRRDGESYPRLMKNWVSTTVGTLFLYFFLSHPVAISI
jgi:hypothetical protein